MKRIILASLLFLGLKFCFAQDFRGYYTASFDFNQPLSNTNSVNSTSAFGMKVGYNRLLNEKFSLGGELNWGTYKQYHPTETFYNESGAVTTDYFKYVYAYGLVLSGRYLFSYDHLFNPYAGLGMGVAYNKYTTFYNVYADQNKVLGFLVRPEAGLLIRFSQLRSVGGLIGIHYDYSTARDKSYGYNNFSNLGINVGIVILDW